MLSRQKGIDVPQLVVAVAPFQVLSTTPSERLTPTSKVLSRKPHYFNASHHGTSATKKQRFSSQDFAGFYSPRQQYENIQKGKIDLTSVLPKTPRKQEVCHTARMPLNQPNPSTGNILMKTPPTKSQLRIHLKLTQISKDAQNFRQNCRMITQAVTQPIITDKSVLLQQRINQLQSEVNDLSHQNKRLKQQNSQLLHEFSKNQQTHHEITTRLKDSISILEQQLHDRSQYCDKITKQLGQFRNKLEEYKHSSEYYDQLQKKVCYLEHINTETVTYLHKQREQHRYSLIELSVLRLKINQAENGKSFSEERQKLMQSNRRLKRETQRLKSQLYELNDDLFELSPQRCSFSFLFLLPQSHYPFSNQFPLFALLRDGHPKCSLNGKYLLPQLIQNGVLDQLPDDRIIDSVVSYYWRYVNLQDGLTDKTEPASADFGRDETDPSSTVNSTYLSFCFQINCVGFEIFIFCCYFKTDAAWK